VEHDDDACDQVMAALSARFDGEAPGMADHTVRVHLRTCTACRAFRDALERPDAPLADRVVRQAAVVDRGSVWWVLRVLLGLVAAGYLIASVPELLFSADPHHGHLAHHLGIFEAAYGCALLLVAVRPARARAMVPFTVVLAVGMLLVALADVASGEALPLAELSHSLEFAGLLLVWMLATRRGWPGRAPEVDSGDPPSSGPVVSDTGDGSDTAPALLRVVRDERSDTIHPPREAC
jgi:hypothetical protein